MRSNFYYHIPIPCSSSLSNIASSYVYLAGNCDTRLGCAHYCSDDSRGSSCHCRPGYTLHANNRDCICKYCTLVRHFIVGVQSSEKPLQERHDDVSGSTDALYNFNNLYLV